MNDTRTITKVTARWDDPQSPSIDAGWYCESWADDELVADSQKLWFPVEVDDLHLDETAELRERLEEAFPEAEIVISED